MTIVIQGGENQKDNFIEGIHRKSPKLSRITSLEIRPVIEKSYASFEISNSKSTQTPTLFISPDHALCDACKSEIRNPQNRRFQYPFTSCLNCGPRYSIIDKVPYDRSGTTMNTFAPCDRCLKEYQEKGSKREHAQSLSCPTCKIQLNLWKENSLISTEASTIFQNVKSALEREEIVAIKSMAGFLICCHGFSSRAITELRKRKNRRDKPLAIMYSDMQAIRDNYYVSKQQEVLITSSTAPIVLLIPKKNDLPFEVKKDLSRVGVFLPPTPLLQLILDQCDFPLIATSGNISGEPIIYEDQDVLSKLTPIADIILSHELEIVMPQDDSVIQLSQSYNQKIILRRSRGLAPEFIHPMPLAGETVFAFGADLKNTFSFQHEKNIFVSQHIGDMSTWASHQRAEHICDHFMNMFNLQPSMILADQNSNFFSTALAKQFADTHSLPFKFIQHHEAHYAAILSEHNLWDSNESILGVIWDGSGYGYDGNVWGGEFFRYADRSIKRIGHISMSAWLLGNKMSIEPRIAALAYFNNIQKAQPILNKKFSSVEWNNYSRIIHNPNLLTSSMGRWFDAIASVLNLCDINDFEGQAAMLLEDKASNYVDVETINSYPIKIEEGIIDLTVINNMIIEDIVSGTASDKIAIRFHFTLVEIIQTVAALNDLKHLAFSGGVFQNALLVDLIIEKLGAEFTLYFHEDLSPNDENISFGQLMHHHFVETD